MNAVDPIPPLASAPAAGSVARAAADDACRLLRRIGLGVGLACLVLGALRLAAASVVISPDLAQHGTALQVLAAFRRSGLPAVTIGALLLSLAGIVATWIMAAARLRAARPVETVPPARHRGHFRRWQAMLRPRPAGDPALVGRAAHWPQAIAVGTLALAAVVCLCTLRAAPGLPPAPQAARLALGGAVVALCFPLLVVERFLAALPPARLPEAPALRTLLFCNLLAWSAAGLIEIAGALGLPFAPLLDLVLIVALSAIAVELTLRALGRCFLPPPEPDVARAAVDSLLARLIADGVQARGIIAPVRQHLGIDFARSWALAYLRAAAPHVALLLLLLCWGLSGVVLVGLDQRAVYERFGAPVAVLHPGLHAILPWPMGRVRRLEFGTIHEITLSDAGAPAQAIRVGAEDRAPPDADRLWEQPHPGELNFLIASQHDAQQSFQVVSADIRLQYRLGLSDEDALRAVYRTADPAALLRGAAGRVIASFFAGRTLDAVLGENREAMAEGLRAEVQRELDRIGCGVELTAVVIEAIHPPAGAAEAYHNVQAAEILAVASIAAEHGRAAATLAKAQEYAADMVAQSRAAAAETTAGAAIDLTRFTADDAAARAYRDSFLLERYLSDVAGGLAKAPLTIIDHRIPAPDAPVIDLRPPGAATAPAVGPGLE